MKKLLERFNNIRFFGHRYTVLVTACFFLALVWSGSAFAYYHYTDPAETGHILSLLVLCVLVGLWFRHHSLTWAKGITRPSWGFFVRSLLAAIELSLWGLVFAFSCALYVLAEEQGLTWATAWPFYKNYVIFLVAVPLGIAQGIPFVYYQLIKYFGVSRMVRQGQKGKGGQMAFAGLPSYYDKGVRYRWFSGRRTASVLLGSTTYAYDPKIRYISENSDSNILTIANIGSGKSTCAIYPVLATYAGSVIVLDPKGEHTAMTHRRRSGKSLRYKGQVFCVDPFRVNADLPSVGYNPLSEIDPESNDPGLINAIAEACVIEQKDDMNIHFTENARSLIAGLIAHVLSYYPKEKHTLPFILDQLYGVDPDTKMADPERFKELLRVMRLNFAFGGLPQQAAKDLLDMGDRERGGVLSTTARSLKWIGEPHMRKHLSAPSAFEFGRIGTDGKSTTVYITLPLGKMESQKRWFRVLATVGIARMRDRAKRPKIPTLFILDEAYQLGRMDIIKKSYAALRSSGTRLWAFYQNFSQLVALFGEDAYTFIANATKQSFGVNDLQTAELISESLGTKLVEGTPQPLLTPAEVMSDLSKDNNRQIIFPAKETNGRDNLPYYLERLTYIRYRSDFRPWPGHWKYYPSRWSRWAKKAAQKLSFFFSTAAFHIRQFLERQKGAL